MVLVELAIPRRAEFVALARLVVSSVAGERYELDDDQLDSLKLAVSEACVLAIDDSTTAERSVRVGCQGIADGIEITVEGVAAEGVSSDPAGDRMVPSLPFIASLVDEAAIEETTEGRSRVRMRLACQRARQL